MSIFQEEKLNIKLCCFLLGALWKAAVARKWWKRGQMPRLKSRELKVFTGLFPVRFSINENRPFGFYYKVWSTQKLCCCRKPADVYSWNKLYRRIGNALQLAMRWSTISGINELWKYLYDIYHCRATSPGHLQEKQIFEFILVGDNE